MSPLPHALQRKSPYLLLALAVLVLDQWTKWWVETALPRHRPVPVIDGLLNLVHVENTGVAFGLLATRGHALGTLLLTLLGVVALLIVCVYFWRTPPGDRLLLSALGLILGGALGNIADRVAAGAVTDFIDFYWGTYHWHTFNVADSAITIGILLMAFEILLPRRSAGGAPEKAPATEAGASGERS